MDSKSRSEKIPKGITRRQFVEWMGMGGVALGLTGVVSTTAAETNQRPVDADGRTIPGFEKVRTDPHPTGEWKPFSDRKLRVGIAGYGLCRFGAEFGFQDHPLVEVVAVTDLIPERCVALAKACRCGKTYPSCEEMIKDDRIEAVFLATDAPSHGPLSIKALNHGKHVACAVPAVFGSLEEAEKLFETVKRTGLKYMLFETSYYHDALYAWHQQYKAGGFGDLVYSEGEYFHYFGTPYPGYNPRTNKVDTDGWRKGLPPQWYPTHSNAYYIGVTGGSFTEVSCMGRPSIIPHLRPENNDYRNPFGSEIALFRTSDGGMSRMAVCWDLATASVEQGRVYGQKNEQVSVNTVKPPLPPGVAPGGHGGSHGYLMNEFVEAVLCDRKPWVDVAQALNLTVAGIVAHQSALRDGELMKIPQYTLTQG